MSVRGSSSARHLNTNREWGTAVAQLNTLTCRLGRHVFDFTSKQIRIIYLACLIDQLRMATKNRSRESAGVWININNITHRASMVSKTWVLAPFTPQDTKRIMYFTFLCKTETSSEPRKHTT